MIFDIKGGWGIEIDPPYKEIKEDESKEECKVIYLINYKIKKRIGNGQNGAHDGKPGWG